MVQEVTTEGLVGFCEVLKEELKDSLKESGKEVLIGEQGQVIGVDLEITGNPFFFEGNEYFVFLQVLLTA